MRTVFSIDRASTLVLGVMGVLMSLKGLKLKIALSVLLEVAGLARTRIESAFSVASTIKASLQRNAMSAGPGDGKSAVTSRKEVAHVPAIVLQHAQHAVEQPRRLGLEAVGVEDRVIRGDHGQGNVQGVTSLSTC